MILTRNLLWNTVKKRIDFSVFCCLTELGTRDNCCDNLTMFSGQPIVVCCLIVLLDVATPFGIQKA